jgi:glycosyltransferase involved in cell wall biosynthesis/peptidoglycan/xylan/chitin deacetylase (PgdA/CDA1 family)
MKIWHVGAAPNPYRVDGVSRTVWLMSLEQARLGHDVSLVLDASPTKEAQEMAAPVGLKLLDLTASHWTYASEIRALLDVAAPDVVHMHSVFIPRQATLARVLQKRHIPYLITPHAGLAPQVLARGRVKKSLYSAVRERPRFMGASAIALVTPAEEKAVRSFLPHYRGIVRWMPNPVDFSLLDPHRWQGLAHERRLAFLGRFDVLVKGIDILVEIARLLPGVKVDLYGTEDPKTLDWLNRIRQDLPANVAFHDPIFGKEKARLLSEASLYIQPSRWEGFPVSVAECLYLGVPSSITGTLDLSQLFYQHDLGLVLSLKPPEAAKQIESALADEGRMRGWSQRGREFALTHFAPAAVAENHVRLYDEVIRTTAVPTTATTTATATATSDAAPAGANGHPRARRRRPRPRLVPVQLRGLLKQNVSRVFERSGHFRPTGAPRTVVLCYHSIAQTDAALSIEPAVFAQQVLVLKEMGFEFLSFGELVHRVMGWGSPKNNVACITFDDGFADNYEYAAPILAEHGVPATFFITTGLMLGEPAVLEHFRSLTRFDTSYLSQSQVRQMSRAGFEIAAHTHTHPNLGRLSAERARWEIMRCKAVLEDTIGQAVRSFAYPFGKRHIHYTARTVNLVRESGYQGAGSVAFRGVSTRSIVRIFEMPRFFVTRGDTPTSFQQKVAGHFDWLGSFQEASPAWLKSVISPEDRY